MPGKFVVEETELDALAHSPWSEVPRHLIPSNWRSLSPQDALFRDDLEKLLANQRTINREERQKRERKQYRDRSQERSVLARREAWERRAQKQMLLKVRMLRAKGRRFE